MKIPHVLCKFGLLFSLLMLAMPMVASAEKLQSESLKGLPLIAAEDFEHGTKKWKPTDDSAWEIQQEGDNHVFSLTKKKSDYEPPVRSPYNRAIYQAGEFGDVILDLKLQSTSPDYNHRSLCLFFGYQDESHFYYVHFGKKTDDHANQIFIVNDAPRTKISTKTTPGTNWDDEWHHARVIRKVQDGTIEIYFDDMETPIMTATDKTFQHGRIGIGSFDDPGRFDDIKIYGNPIK